MKDVSERQRRALDETSSLAKTLTDKATKAQNSPEAIKVLKECV